MTGPRRGALCAAGAIALWSLNAAAASVALAQLSVWRVLFVQFAAAAVAVAVVRWRLASGRRRGAAGPVGRRTDGWPAREAVAVGAVALAGTIVLQYVAFATAPIVAANAVAYAWPLLASGWLALRRPAFAPRALPLLAALAFTGVVLLLADTSAASGDRGNGNAGLVAAALSAVAMAVYTLRAGDHRPTDLLLPGLLAGVLAVAGPALADPAPWGPVGAVVLSAGIGLGALAGGYGLWTLAMASPLGPRLAPVAYATPLLSTLALLASGQRLGAAGLAGCALILSGVTGTAVSATRKGRSHGDARGAR